VQLHAEEDLAGFAVHCHHHTSPAGSLRLRILPTFHSGDEALESSLLSGGLYGADLLDDLPSDLSQ
ncbi:MAG: hypothetical protein OXQ89_23410, partial [Rhodospirillaceae bacterium]|nr:hypothetical protein [Rhodospirillaceae bacterium]